MFRIGDFSRFSQVSIRTLRHYDDIGLLKPVNTDPLTGYRYYALDQLARLNRILALRDLDFSLEQVAQVLDKDPTPDAIFELLARKQAELQQRIRNDQQRLAHVEARLDWVKREKMMPAYDVILKTVEVQTIISVRESVPTLKHLPERFGIWTHELYNLIKVAGFKPVGPFCTIYADTEYREKDINVEFAVPVNTAGLTLPVSYQGPVQVRALPEVLAASTIQEGPYNVLTGAYNALGVWIGSNGYQVAGPSREIYLRGPQEEGEPVTEIQFPVKKI